MRTKLNRKGRVSLPIILTAIVMLAITFTFNACSGDDGNSDNPSISSPSSGSSGKSELCNGVSYDPSVYRCELGKLIGKCRGVDYYIANQRCDNGVIVSMNSNYCYGYLNYKDCNLIGGKWITDEQHCFSGGGNIVNTDYCNRNGINIDDTPSDRQSSSSVSSNANFCCFDTYEDQWNYYPGYCGSINDISANACEEQYGRLVSNCQDCRIAQSSSSTVPSSSSVAPSSSSVVPSSSSSSQQQSGSSITQSSSSGKPCATAADNTSTQYCSNGTMKTYGYVTYGGQTYKTVEIGTQTWMAENLNYNITGSACYGNNSTYCETYGRLYTLTVAKSVCPENWHLPSYSEWNSLIEFVGKNPASINYDLAGSRLKARSGWDRFLNTDGNGTDTYGFAALPGGGFGTVYGSAGEEGNWWNANYNYYPVCMHSSWENVGLLECGSTSMASVRCLKD
jgi:uncharacterized protein (TIGR02145 family)